MRTTSYGALALMVGALGLSACSGMELERAESASPQGDDFTQALYAGYVELAGKEFSEGDYGDSDVFARRAISAANGEAVAPESLSDRVQPEDTIGELTSARSRLVAALDASARDKVPGDAARAQVMFECWTQEQEENFQPDHIAACRGGFYDALAVAEAAVAGQPAPEPAPAAEPAFQPLSYVVYFGFDSTTVTETGQATIERAATYALANAGTRVEVVGHTDRAGDPVYNDALAKKRSSAVAEALTKVGIPASLIKVDSRGESEPAEETAENEKSRLNRRVTILVTQ